MDLNLQEQITGVNGPLSGEKIVEVNSINGGCIHLAWKIKLATGLEFFAKTSSREHFLMLEYEASGLTALNKQIDQDYLIIPKPIALQQLETSAILILPWIQFGQGNERKLGQGLAMLHQQSSIHHQENFGWGADGFIGLNPQIMGWNKSWGKCFVELRLTPQIEMAKQWNLSFDQEKFRTNLIKYLEKHNPIPSLVHGDLWNGNAAMHKNGKGILFDPATWWADREVDIAMTKLFGGFSQNFYESYESTWKLPEGHQERVAIYNLYHILNHANLFGGGYKNRAIKSIKEINSLLEKY